jgi:hypothetical protein
VASGVGNSDQFSNTMLEDMTVILPSELLPMRPDCGVECRGHDALSFRQ